MNGSQNGHQWYDYEDWRRQVVGQDVNVARVVQLNHRWIFFSLLEGHYRASRSLENRLGASFARFVQPGFAYANEPDAMIPRPHLRVTTVTQCGLFRWPR